MTVVLAEVDERGDDAVIDSEFPERRHEFASSSDPSQELLLSFWQQVMSARRLA